MICNKRKTIIGLVLGSFRNLNMKMRSLKSKTNCYSEWKQDENDEQVKAISKSGC